MKLTKKLISVILAVVMLICMSTNVFASTNEVYDIRKYEDDMLNPMYYNPEEIYGVKEIMGFEDLPQSQIPRINNGMSTQNQPRLNLYDETWFRLARGKYSNYESNYMYNDPLDTSSRYIYGQANCPEYKVGNALIKDVGCEIVATYNSLRLKGRVVRVSNIIRTFEKDGYLMANGILGSDPYAIGDFFDQNQYSYNETTDFDTLDSYVSSKIGKASTFIVSFWNSSSIWDGLHTVAFYTTTYDNYIHVYNYYNSDVAARKFNSLSEFVDSERYIVGYQLT